MRYAFVQNGVVQEAWSRDPFELFDAGYAAMFVSCPDEVQQGWLYADGVFSAPPAPPPPPEPPKPTKEQLFAKLQELQQQIAALSN